MRKTFFILLVILPGLGILARAQTSTLSGKVTDETGAVIPQATVTVMGADGKQTTATTDGVGDFRIQSLAPGTYTVAAGAQGFATFSKPGVVLAPGHNLNLNVTLDVQAQEEKIEVRGDEGRPELGVSASSNASALVIKGKDLEALSDDPDELQSELQALAGPAAGPNGGQIYIDGFTGGQLPPKSSIREIRINQNPFSAEYDKLGYGRIEIFTKPGSDKYHGQFFFNDSNSVLNSKNPYVQVKPSYNSDIFDGNFGGPINKRASFFLDASRRNIDDFSAILAVDPNNLPSSLPTNVPARQNLCLTGVLPCVNESFPNPRTRTSFSPRVDVQLTANNTLTARYHLTHDTENNSGLGTFSLPSSAYNLNETEHTVQISDTQIFGPKIVNETRFQFERDINHQLPLGPGGQPTIDVQQSFTTGQNSEGLARTTENNYELQNYTSITKGNHLIKFGARLRGIDYTEFTNANFNGEFIFSAIDPTDPLSALKAYQSSMQGNCPGTAYDPKNCPSQFMWTIGSPNVSVGWFDAGLYAEDEWRAKPNLSLTYGLRFESQNNIRDHADLAPRLGLAWGLGGGDGKAVPKTVLRAGFGIFYDRFGYNLIEQATLLNGVTQQKAVVENPQFFSTNPSNWPSFSTLTTTGSPTIYRVSPNLTSPYTIQSAASIEHQVTKAATVSVTYLNTRGEHAFYIDNVNAPAPWLSGGRPLGTNENIYTYESGGIYRQNQVIVNGRVNTGRRLSLFGFYTLSYANSNVASGGSAGGFFSSGGTTRASFVTDQFDPMADYGRAAFDVRHRAFIGGNLNMPYGFSLFPFIIINSGAPYNLTTGQDNNGDSLFNDRPWLANANEHIVCTDRTDFSIAPPTVGSPTVPINYCTGPANTTFNLRLSKTIGFGPEAKGGGGGGGGPHGHRGGGLGGRGLSGGGGNPFSFGQATNRRYNLTLSISVRNLFNTFNPGNPVGNLSSPLFGQTLSVGGGPFASASANRRVDLQARFSF